MKDALKARVLLLSFVLSLYMVLGFEVSSTSVSGSSGVASSTASLDEIVFESPEGVIYSSEYSSLASDTRLAVDYIVDDTPFTVVFKSNPDDYTVRLSKNGHSVGFIPKRMSYGNMKLFPDFRLYFNNKHNLSYKNVFGDGINIDYLIQDNRLKENIIISDDEALGPDSVSSSTLAIDFIIDFGEEITPSLDGRSEWAGEDTITSSNIFFIRKPVPGRLYAINQFFKILKPSVTDTTGDRFDLNYRLYRDNGGTHVEITIPPDWLKTATYPISVDPTLEFMENDDGFVWMNEDLCGTHTDNCTDYMQTSDMKFEMPYLCNLQGNQVVVKKPIFFFHTSDLEDMYPGGSVESAKIYLKGSCSGQSYMEDNDYINFYEIGEVDASPTCGSNLDADVRDTISVLMTKTSCDYSGGDWRTITDNFAAAVNNQSNLSFKIDISPARGDDDAPTTSFSYNINDNKLEIEYYFTCTSSNNCPETQYCEDLTTDLCELDLDYGDDCEDVAVDDDDYACENENCQYDDFDGSGHYCTEDNKCLHNGDRFNNGYIHCADDDSYTKTCQGTTWSSSTACSYGCDEGTGCATTTTTSSTTTTLAPDISINPGSLTFRRYV